MDSQMRLSEMLLIESEFGIFHFFTENTRQNKTYMAIVACTKLVGLSYAFIGLRKLGLCCIGKD